MNSDLWQGNWHNLYIHLPFCASKCGYCAFYSETASGVELRRRYLKSVIDFLQQIEFPGAVRTLYLGGGTPNFLTAQELAGLFENIRKYVPLSSDCEVSCELNPECMTGSKLTVLNEHANRLSLGVQSFDSAVRQKLMRRCSQQALKNALQLLEKRRARHFNIDLIYGIAQVPWQTFESDLLQALDHGADHLSCYALTAEENSRLGLDSPVADDCDAADWWLKIGEVLRKYDMDRYEISNYAFPGAECRHNLNVWRGDTLLGAGAAAAGYNGRERYNFPPDIQQFIDGCAPEIDSLPPEERLLEIFAVNLRTTAGWQQQQWELLYPGSWPELLARSRQAQQKHPDRWVVKSDRIQLSETGLLFWDDAALEVIDWIDR